MAIQWIGPQAAEAIPTLVRKVREEEDLLDAHEYGRTLAKIGAPAVPALEALLREAGGEHARSAGGAGLARCGPRGVAALRAALALPDGAVRKEAASRLGAAPPEAESAKALIPLLQDAQPRVRQAAAWSLGTLGDLARDAGPGLLRMLDEPDAAKTVRGIVRDASGDFDTHLKSVCVLGAMGSPAREALDGLLPFVTLERGSVSFPPQSVLRVMASADLARAIALVSR